VDELIIEILDDALNYDTSDFDCGETALNVFLQSHLKRQHDGKILRAYVLRARHNTKVLGYYTLSGSCFERATLPSKTQQRKIPYQNVPSVTLGRLAVDKSLQGAGWGSTLVAHALKVVFSASQAVGIHGVFVDAKNDRAKAFYLSLNFIPLAGDNRNAFFFPTASIEQLFS